MILGKGKNCCWFLYFRCVIADHASCGVKRGVSGEADAGFLRLAGGVSVILE